MIILWIRTLAMLLLNLAQLIKIAQASAGVMGRVWR